MCAEAGHGRAVAASARPRWLRREALRVSILLASLAPSNTARAQACCAATGVVIPARLRVYEDLAVGLQARGRQSYGSFASDGTFATTSSGDLVTEQTLFALWRALPRLQVGLLLPYVETWRRVPGRSEWGGFVADVAASARVEVLRPGDLGRALAVTVLGGVSVPTGRAPDEARNPLGTDAAGSGSYEGTLGLEVEATWERWFASVDAWVTERSSRDAPGGRQEFGPRFTVLVAGGCAFGGRISAAAFASVTRGGATRGASLPETDTRMAVATAGVAGLFPLGEAWRLQAALAADLPVGGWGRNQPATAVVGTSLVRAWP